MAKIKNPPDDAVPHWSEPPTPPDPELEALLARFVARQKTSSYRRYCWDKGCDALTVTPDGIERE